MARVRDLTDQILGGQLVERLREWRAQGLSYDAIARELDHLGVPVAGQTVRRWFDELEIETAGRP